METMLRLTLLLVIVAMATAFPTGHMVFPVQSQMDLFEPNIHRHSDRRLCKLKHGVSRGFANTISPWVDRAGGFIRDDQAYGFGEDAGVISFGQFGESDIHADRFGGLGLVGPYGQYERLD